VRIYRQALARIEEIAKTVSPDDQSLAASGLCGFTTGHAEGIRQSGIRSVLRGYWQALFMLTHVPTQAFPPEYSPQYALALDVDGTKDTVQ